MLLSKCYRPLKLLRGIKCHCKMRHMLLRLSRTSGEQEDGAKREFYAMVPLFV